MRNLSKKSKAIIAGAAIAGLASAGGAYAYWTSTGNGSGAALTGTSTAFEVTTDSAYAGGPLTPGVGIETVTFHVVNPSGSGVQRLSHVAVTVATSPTVAWTSVAGCSAADYTVGTPSFTPGEIAGGATVSGTVTITMVNRHDAVEGDNSGNQDGCKGATVPLVVAAS